MSEISPQIMEDTEEVESSPVIHRGRRHYLAASMTIAALISVLLMRTSDCVESVASLAFSLLVVLLAQLLWRSCLLVEEWFHAARVCNGRLSELLNRTFYFNSSTVMVALLSGVAAWSTKDSIQGCDPTSLLISFFVSSILLFMTRAEDCSTYKAHTMINLKGLDYGSGMAHSFYYGYLKLILPGLRKRIVGFMEAKQIKQWEFPVRKLIILIPSSGYCYPLLSDIPTQDGCDPDVEPLTRLDELLEHTLDRAGAKSRKYGHTCYKFRIMTERGPRFLYAVTEGATPLLTLKEAYSSDSPEALHLKQHRLDVVSNFYRTLKGLIENDISCRDFVDLLYYNDEDRDKQPDIVAILREHLIDVSDQSVLFGPREEDESSSNCL